jgi:anti-sigma B factor antagonist
MGLGMNLDVNSESVLLQLRGRLDAQSCSILQQELAALESDRFHLWILDLAQVDFIDSSGLVALVTGLKLATRRRCRLAIFDPHPSARLIFEITQLDQVLDYVTSTDVADLAPIKIGLRLLPSYPKAA